ALAPGNPPSLDGRTLTPEPWPGSDDPTRTVGDEAPASLVEHIGGVLTEPETDLPHDGAAGEDLAVAPRAPGEAPVDTTTYPPVGSGVDPEWTAAREAASVGVRAHLWVDPVSRPGPSGRHRYAVRSGFDVRRFL